MDRHAVPRSVTTFEFKLIGWFTVKQFIYLLLFAGVAVIIFFIIPVPILNIIMSVLTAAAGAIFVLYKHNERPLDIWIRNLINSLFSPSQFFYHKENPVPAFLQGVYLTSDEKIAETHIDAREKLSKYMTQTGQGETTSTDKQNMNQLIHTTPAQHQPQPQVAAQTQGVTGETQQVPNTDAQQPMTDDGVQQPEPQKDKPFLSGIVRNNKEAALPDIMIYVNSDAGQVVRILKTNHNGIFATFHPLPTGTFILSPKDLSGNYFFDTMNITIEGPLKEPLQIFSKELL